MRERIELWKRVYDTDDNAITKALSKMAWDLAAYSCLVEVVRQAPGEELRKHLNGMFLEMMATGFWSHTMQGIRRVAERLTIHGQYGVCSLGGLIQDVRAVREQLTREVFVRDIPALEYNYEATRARHWDFVWARHAAGEKGAPWDPRDLKHGPAQQRHAEFDWLSGTTPGNSRPDDLIRPEVFDALEQRLRTLESVAEHVTTQIAHAATEASRQGRVLDQWGLVDAKEAIKQLAQVAELVGNWFCFSGIGTMLPNPLFDQFEYLDQPLFTGDTRDLQGVWDALSEEIGNWHTITAQDL